MGAIADGMVPRFVPFLRSSAFRERFLAKGRFATYLETVAIHAVTHPNPGLLGAAVALRGSIAAVPLAPTLVDAGLPVLEVTLLTELANRAAALRPSD